MTKEGTTEIVTFMTPGVLALGRGHISKIFPIKIIFSTPTTFFYLYYPNNKDLTVGHLWKNFCSFLLIKGLDFLH